MTALDEFDLALGALESAEHAVDAVARVTVNAPDPPAMKALDKEIADGLRHRLLLQKSWLRPPRLFKETRGPLTR